MNARGIAADELRRHNLSTLLERVHLEGPTARSALTSDTGLNRSTVSALVTELTELGLAAEGPAEAATGPGRPSPTVHPRPEGAVVLAISIGVSTVTLATIGLGGHRYDTLEIPHVMSGSRLIADVDSIAAHGRNLIEALPCGARVAGAGVGVGGVVRTDGFVHYVPHLQWFDVDLPELFGERLGLEGRVRVENNADLGAFAEHRRGKHEGVRNLLFLYGDDGIGLGIIANGELLRGAAGYVGEVGHMMIDPNGMVCRCERVGCWETTVSGAAMLLRMANRDDVIDSTSIVELARAGDPETLEMLADVGHWLGIGIGNLISLFNPRVVAIGGLLYKLYPYVEPTMEQARLEQGIWEAGEMATVLPSRLGEDAVIVGAAEWVLTEVIADPAGWVNDRK